jgi:phosphatidylserine/phosphatidylglycerophosphate/cardiolipin synthase-like enzyme
LTRPGDAGSGRTRAASPGTRGPAEAGQAQGPPGALRDRPITRLDVLLTAAEAYPAFERAFLDAEHSISASFRIFDLGTRLRSGEARAIGRDWFDLLIHTLDRGVHVRIAVSDFDPIGGADLHRLCWRSRRKFVAAGDLAAGGRLEVVSALHGCEAGPGARVILAPGAFLKLRELVRRLNGMSLPERARFLEEAPGVTRATYDRGGAVAMRPHLPRLYPATHHQKIAVFDRKRLYIGGLDLNERRYDTPRHRRAPERTWHDVQAMVEGPVVDAAQAHLDSFLDAAAGRRAPPASAPGFLRTLSRPARNDPFRFSPHPDITEIEDAHLRLIAGATHLIYLETQFFRHVPLARALARRARACPALRLILLLPAAPEDVAFENSSGLDARYGEHLQTKCLSILRKGFGRDRMLVLSPVQPRGCDENRDADGGADGEANGRDSLKQAPLIYVHSKVSIFDDRAAILSSANLNGRSLRWDTEAGLELTEREQVSDMRRRVMGNWLPDGFPEAALAPDSAFDHWKALADRNSRLSPEERAGFLVHYDSAPAREMGMPVPGVPEEMV